MSAIRRFGALIAFDGVCLVEYHAERTGTRILEHWMDRGRSTSIDEALDRLLALLASRNVTRAKIAIAVEQFGVFHHVMTLPGAADEVLQPVIRREVQRVFGVPDPVIAFTRSEPDEPKQRDTNDAAPRQVFIGGAPRDVVDALRDKLTPQHIEIEIATVVPKAIHSLYEATGGALEPTAVLVCLEGGPHLAFFLGGRLELAIDPPIALEGERPPVSMILDQVDRGVVYFRQQFRGATATRLLLSAPDDEYDELGAALEQRLGVRVKPLFAGATSPEVAVAMGAVLEAQRQTPLDLFPHAPTVVKRVGAMLRGPNAIAAAAATAAAIAGMWAVLQFTTLAGARSELATVQKAIAAGVPAVEPMRLVAERRADFARQMAFLRGAHDERRMLTTTLQALAEGLPAGVRFDSVRVSRTPTGWSAAIGGQSAGGSAAQAVRGFDTFYQSVRSRPGIAVPTLDHFDYPAAAAVEDSTHSASAAPVVIQFHLSFSMAPKPEAAR